MSTNQINVGDDCWIEGHGHWRFARVVKVTPKFVTVVYTAETGRPHSPKRARDECLPAYTKPSRLPRTSKITAKEADKWCESLEPCPHSVTPL